MSTVERVLGLIDLFTEDMPVWTTEELIAKQQTSRATTYRDLKALLDAGFLSPVAAGAYGLGPRFIELDRQIRIGDPLLKAAVPVMAAQRAKVGGTQLLFRHYGIRVLSIHEDRADERIKTSFDRGRPFTLFQGSHSRVILAHLPVEQQQRLFLSHADEIARVGLGKTWPAFREVLSTVRARGVAVASDIDKELVGVAAPLFVVPETVAGALVLARIKKEVDEAEIERLTKLANAAAKKISATLLARPSRLKDC